MSIRTYNPSVRVGNWNEDICLEEDLLKDFLDKKEKGELLIQKSNKLLQNILKTVQLSVSTDGFIHFGDSIMIVNPGQEGTPQSLQQIDPPRPPTALSVNMDEYAMYHASKVEGPCPVSASPMLNPCTRNVFIVTSVDGTENGMALRFGQPFTFSTPTGYAGNLKLLSDHARFNLHAKKSRQQIVELVDEVNYLATWQILAFHPQQRLEYEGFPVPANSKVIILHNKTGQMLIAYDKYKIRTPFGYECEVSAQTTLDSHKAEKDNNHWVLVTGNPSDNETTHFDRPLPQPSGVPKTDKGASKAELEKADVKPCTT